MRTILFLRGVPGCGKSTWIIKNALEGYTISPDEIRLLYSAPVLLADGTTGISQANNTKVWNVVNKIIENKMENGEFIVLDSTMANATRLEKYKPLCKKYNYRSFCVDFSNASLDLCLNRNKHRPEYKQVPDTTIKKMYKDITSTSVPEWMEIISPDDIYKTFIKPIDLSEYKKIHHIGDIHGCYSVLQEYFDLNGGYKNDEFYIFTGDYIDRGVENDEVIRFLDSIHYKKNVLLLEGNHEKWLRYWTSGETELIKSREFIKNTMPQLEEAGLKRASKRICKDLVEVAYYIYNGKKVLVTHGGVNCNISNCRSSDLSFTPTSQIITGVGKYEECELVENTFFEKNGENVYQIHGHRNINQNPINANKNNFNLEGQVEHGGELRIAQLTKEAGFSDYSVKNNVYKKTEYNDEKTLMENLRENPYIKESVYDNISSFNFTREAFFNQIWNAQTVKARGLFFDTEKGCICARGYEKFFNIDERPETTMSSLKNTLKFPISAYQKENGFLGIVGYNYKTDELLITSKSCITGKYSKIFADILKEKMGSTAMSNMKKYIKDNNVSFVFECVDIKNDPHIIEYNQNKVVLLDIIKNCIHFKKYDYEQLQKTKESLSLPIDIKKQEIILNTWKDFSTWFDSVKECGGDLDNPLEGFVIEDANGFMFKYKTNYYLRWKYLRTVSQRIIKNKSFTAPLENKEMEDFRCWLTNLVNTSSGFKNDIISLRNMYYMDNK